MADQTVARSRLLGGGDLLVDELVATSAAQAPRPAGDLKQRELVAFTFSEQQPTAAETTATAPIRSAKKCVPVHGVASMLLLWPTRD
jgi:hypothetical protein